jgi:trehalose-6-phosphate synthase
MLLKSELWPLFHYILWSAVADRKDGKTWESYVRVNQAFADQVVANYTPGDTIWIHDYHFLMMPAMLRKALPNATIGFYLHAPFPSSELFRCLPRTMIDKYLLKR